MAAKGLSRSAKSTLISVGFAASLLVIAGIAISMLPPSGPASAAEAERSVTAMIDRIVDTIPQDSVLDMQNEATVAPCVTDPSDVTISLRRLVTVDPALDRVAWFNTIRGLFSDPDEWSFRVRALDARDNLRMTIVGTDLSRFIILATGDVAAARVSVSVDTQCAPGETP